MRNETIGFALCGSFCTFERSFRALEALRERFENVIPIVSGATASDDTRFGTAQGNTLAKLSLGISDGAVTLATKAHLRNGRPVVIAISSNDALSAGAENLGRLLNRKHHYFVPFYQDSPEGKPTSLIADLDRLIPTVEAALEGRQLQPLILQK